MRRPSVKQSKLFALLLEFSATGKVLNVEHIIDATGYKSGAIKPMISKGYIPWLKQTSRGEYLVQGFEHLTKDLFVEALSQAKHGPPDATLSGKLTDKSIQAALSAIEIYNKPDFKYREESFSILMVNAWELLLKAKIAADNRDRIESLYQMQKDSTGKLVPKPSRSGNPCTITIGEAIVKVSLDQVLKDHLFGLIELRDNAIHLMNESPMLKVKVQEVGTATLRNYLEMAKEWFNVDLSRYNFYLMPMSFFHPHELQSYSINSEPVQHQNLLRYIAALEERHPFEEVPRIAISLELKTVFMKSSMKYAPDDPNAIPVKFESEEAFHKKYRWRYTEDLLPALRKRFSDFKPAKKFYDHKRRLEADLRFAAQRSLDSKNPKSQKKWFYCPDILKEFDKYYTMR